jgi:hypothetical protein
MVFDGEAVAIPNPFGAEEPGLCRELNQRHDAIKQIAKAKLSVDIAEPTGVGVDPWGVDVRARFGVVRVPFTQRLGEPGMVAEAIERGF